MLFDMGDCCDCGGGGVCGLYTVRGCANIPQSYFGFNPGAGVPVRIRSSSGGPIVAEGVTDGDGQVRLCVPSGGSRWIEADVPNMAPYRQSGTTGAGNYFLYVEPLPGGGWCCNNARRPETCTDVYSLIPKLYLTDANGTWAPFVECGWVWDVKSAAVNPVWEPVDLINCDITGTAPIDVRYTLKSTAAGWLLEREWSDGASADGLRKGYNTSTSGLCAGTRTGRSSAVLGATDCRNFFLSGSLSQVSGVMPDPVGGTVVISG